jgi:hypothetical protein
MSATPPALAVLREREFRHYFASRFLSGTGQSLLRAAFGWHVYALTGSEFQLGLLGVIQFVPALALSLVAGALADAHDRRKIILLAQLASLAVQAYSGRDPGVTDQLVTPWSSPSRPPRRSRIQRARMLPPSSRARSRQRRDRISGDDVSSRRACADGLVVARGDRAAYAAPARRRIPRAVRGIRPRRLKASAGR